MKVVGIIPARMASTRFPNKPLVDIGGKTMIQRVYEQAAKSDVLEDLYVATDHLDIKTEVERFGGKAFMTATFHENGTARCAEVLEILHDDYDVLINIQGDEPFFEPDSLETLVKTFNNPAADIATLVTEIKQSADVINPSVVKVVFDHAGKALYFSRAAIPYMQSGKAITHFKHIGIYAYRTEVLRKLVHLEESELEQTEKLEQLRWLQNGFNIHVGFVAHDSNSVDTPEDLIALKKQFNIE